MEETRDQDSYQELIYQLIFFPWVFWAKILSISVIPSFIGYSVILTLIISAFFLFRLKFALIFIFLLCLWIGPILIATPLLLLFTIPNFFAGDYDVPIGCTRQPDGRLLCI